jgi:hypothetical protein
MNWNEAVRTLEQEITKLETAKRIISDLADEGRQPKQQQQPKRILSISARKRIAQAQKARWAKYHKAQRKAA